MHILFATAELSPFSRASDTAEAVRHQAAELKLLGHDVSIVTPLYRWISPDEHRLARRLTTLRVSLDDRTLEVGLLEGRTPENARVFFLDCPQLFGRHKSIYASRNGKPYRDNDLRFGLFARLVCELACALPRPLDVLHGQGWACGLIPVFLEERYAEAEALADVIAVQSVDALDQQRFAPAILRRLDLPSYLNHPDHLAVGRDVDYLKGGVLFADLVIVPSQTFASEVQTRALGAGLEDAFREREQDLVAVTPGLDPLLWDPATDEALAQRFDPQHLNGKRQCKAALQHTLGLALRPRTPLLGFLGDLDEPSGAPLLLDALETLLAEDIQLAIIGQTLGDPALQQRLEAAAAAHPRKLAVRVSDDPALLRRALAGCDLRLLLDRVAPSELPARFAQRYGTLLIAVETGAYADAIVDIDDAQDDPGTGFLIERADPPSLLDAVRDAITAHASQRRWREHQLTAMRQLRTRRQAARDLARAYESIL